MTNKKPPMPTVYTVTSLTCKKYHPMDRSLWCHACETGEGVCWDQVERVALHPDIPTHPTFGDPPNRVPFRVAYRQLDSGKRFNQDWDMSCLTDREHRGEGFYAGCWVGQYQDDPHPQPGSFEAVISWLLEGEES